MDLRRHLSLLAAYHRWAFERLYDFLRDVSDTDYRRDCKLYFRSIHGTLNHLLLADRLWHGRFVGQPFAVTGLDQELCTGRAQLRDELLHASGLWRGLIDAVAAASFDGELQFVTTEGQPRAFPYAPTLAHVFNHGTHHRGQISAALTAMGHPAPEIDLYFYLLEQRPDPQVG